MAKGLTGLAHIGVRVSDMKRSLEFYVNELGMELVDYYDRGGTLLGFVWGFTCVLRAFTNPAWILFTNPLISVLPRIFVGMVAGLVFLWARRHMKDLIAVAVAGAAATLTNTVLVLSAMYVFGGMIESYRAFFELFKTILSTLIAVNGTIELAAAIIVVPIIYHALQAAAVVPNQDGAK